MYKPRIYEDATHLDGSEDKIIKEMIALNNDPALRV